MKYVKMLGLLAVTTTALMAWFPISASATTLTSSTGETPTVHAVGITPELHGIATIICHNSTVSATVSSHGPSSTAAGSISSLSFTSCTGADVTVLTNGTGTGTGTLELHAQAPTGNGSLTGNGTRITAQFTSLGVSCIFETQNTQIGTLTSAEEAVLHIESTNVPRVSGDNGIFCGGSVQWTGFYRFIHPTNIQAH